MNITPEEIINNDFKKVRCEDCKYGCFLGDYNWRWCQSPQRPREAVYKKEMIKDGHCEFYRACFRKRIVDFFIRVICRITRIIRIIFKLLLWCGNRLLHKIFIFEK